MGSLKQCPHSDIRNVAFSAYSIEEIEKISVVEITSHIATNALGNHLDNGIYDLKLGSMRFEDHEFCKTCFKMFIDCPGHFGHINLPGPIFNPCFYDCIFKLMSRVCHSCYKFQISAMGSMKFLYEMKFLDAGLPDLAKEVKNICSAFMSEDSNFEAKEVNLDVDEKEIKPKNNLDPLYLSLILRDTLDNIYSNAVKERMFCNSPNLGTSNCSTVHEDILKEFMKNTSKRKKFCMFCQAPRLIISNINSQMVIKSAVSTTNRRTNPKNEIMIKVQEDVIDAAQSFILPDQCRTVLRNCYEQQGEFLKKLFPIFKNATNEHPIDLLFIERLLVTPPKTRPTQKAARNITEHEKSLLYNKIIMRSFCIKMLKPYIEKGSIDMDEVPEETKLILNEFKGTTLFEKSLSLYYNLQLSVNSLLDAKLNPLESNSTSKGIKQVIEKKFGLLRQNLMGKRVNFSARSVAAPDPMLAGDEVGVPVEFALKLSFPEYVNTFNVDKLRKLIMNGPEKHPGAIAVEDEEGKRVYLRANDENQRTALANTLLTPATASARKVNGTKIVFRHLQNGDLVLMNRQPTLHRPSIQAHKARVMPVDRVLRMPYVNCKAYNADFDGDELNLHFPQTYAAQSEAQILVLTHNHYLTPKDGSPLAGLIQDCVVSSVMLTIKGKFFSRDDYQQLVFVAVSGLAGKIKTLPPAIQKPQQLWSGKQIISTIIHNIIPREKTKPTLFFKTQVKSEMWQREEARVWLGGGAPEKNKEGMTESELIMIDGELLCGVIDKCAIGSTRHGLVHTCYDLYGGQVACDLLTAINRLSIKYLEWAGHTISVKEFITPAGPAKRRRKDLKNLVKRAKMEVAEKLDLGEQSLERHIEYHHTKGNEKVIAAVDQTYTKVLGPTTTKVTSENEAGLYRNNLNNHMRMMVDTGAKGSKVNMNQMASLFGSVAIDGKRMPMSSTGKTLPSFKPYECDPRAGGYIPRRFVTGMDPKSYFFLCIVGRDSLQHTAVKTANSGYMQRCLIKHLEGIKVLSDETVRNSDGLVLQFQYGEDGQDVIKMPFLCHEKALDTIVDNFILIEKDNHPKLDPEDLKFIHKWKRQIKKRLGRTGVRSSAFLQFCHQHTETKEYDKNRKNKLASMWHNLSQEQKREYSPKLKTKVIEPLSSKYCGSSAFGVVSEALEDLIDNYYRLTYCAKPANRRLLSKTDIQDIVYKKAQVSRVVPGEPVGALCAQAIGEPLTQMTLNTFHFAGRDELNVTLGVPRMIEILRTASENISTPIMEVPFVPGTSRAAAEKLRKRLTPVELREVVNTVKITSSIVAVMQETRRKCVIKFNFLPHKEYKKVFSLSPHQILHYMENSFLKKILIKQIRLAIKKITLYESSGRVKRSHKDDVLSDEENDDDDESPMMKINKNELTSDEEDDNENEEDFGVASSSRQSKKREQDFSDPEDEWDESDSGGQDDPKIDDVDEDTKDDSSTNNMHPSFAGFKKVNKPSVTEQECRINYMMSGDNFIEDYEYDELNEEWCQITLILPIANNKYDIASILRSTLNTTCIHSIPNIKKAFVIDKNNTGNYLLTTEGVNIARIVEYAHILDVNKLYTNNIHLMQKIYGVEAAQRVVIKEIQSVQSAYGITVDFRHLSLLADYFMCEGSYKACSRFAINSCVSPIQKMSYETCFAFLKTAVINGEVDMMESPSSNVLVGQPVRVGSSCVDLFTQFVSDQ